MESRSLRGSAGTTGLSAEVGFPAILLLSVRPKSSDSTPMGLSSFLSEGIINRGSRRRQLQTQEGELVDVGMEKGDGGAEVGSSHPDP